MGDLVHVAFGARSGQFLRRLGRRRIAAKVLVDDDSFSAILEQSPSVGAVIGVGGLALVVTDVKRVAGGGAIVTCEKIRFEHDPPAAS